MFGVAAVLTLAFGGLVGPDIIHGPGETHLLRNVPLPVFYAVLSLFLVPVVLAIGFLSWSGWHFLRGGLSVQMTRDGLQCPGLPGTRLGRLYRWDDVASLSRLTLEDCPPRLSSFVKLNDWAYRTQATVLFRLNRPVHEVFPLRRLIELYYRVDRLAYAKHFPESDRDFVIVEVFLGSTLRPDELFGCLQSLCEDQHLRQKYVDSDATYEIGTGADGAWSFQLAAGEGTSGQRA